MTHVEARELLELAAAEPHGLERLGAGDTSDAGALAGHLAGCDACREEYGRLARTARVLRTSLATLPPTDLRDRTLARVASEGRVRTPATAPDGVAAAVAARTVAPTEPGRAALVARPGLDRRLVLGWFGSLAAAVVIAVGLSWGVVARPLADQATRDRATASGLAQLTAAAVAVDARPDARHVALTAPSGQAVATLAFAPSTRSLVVISTGLTLPSGGAEYHCWMEAGGQRTQLGRMYFVGNVAAWEGESDAVASVPQGATFGVSLVPTTGGDGAPVLTGTLSGT